ncbi:hypothetical protein AMJ44_04855 [candidate division WOR-1 bacterium DG_54_3]|uniref:Uncharacterized protein n=1 Tax=candidate division WOR-1 bacterium DG_54_3 TaxID=1703775 RepID=A0A0S7Y2S8_UNCSA|nr:MAG: hypothetical protein AMJ44_04855 [candidate division WOR-1 bacterium DG_54_3]
MELRDRIIRLATFILILILGVILYRTFIIPKRKGIKSLKNNLKNIEFQMANVLGEEVALRGGAIEAEELEKTLEKLVLQIPSEKDIPKIINRFLTEVGKGLKIDYVLIQPQKLESEGRYKKLPIELEFTTTYAHFNSYLSQLKTLPEVFRIESLDMRRSPANPDQLYVHLLVSAFVMPGEVEEKIEAIGKETYPEVSPKVSPFKPVRLPQKITTTRERELVKGVEPTLNLQGIMRGELKAAIINDHVLYVDDTIEGYRIINIKENSVVLRKDGRIKILELKY